MEGLDPNLLAVMLFVGGIYFASRDRRENQHTKSVQIDADVLARLKHVEQWQTDHNTIHTCVKTLATKLDAWGEKVDRVTDRFDDFERWFDRQQRRHQSPFDFPGAREWITEDQERRP